MFYLKMFILPLITSIVLVFRIILSIKRPPYIAGMKKKGKHGICLCMGINSWWWLLS